MSTAPATPVCRIGDLVPLRGVPAVVGGEPVALVLVDDRVHAVGDVDPVSGQTNLHRGLVAQRGRVAVLVSPMGEHAFDLDTGVALEDPTVTVDIHDVDVRAGVVVVRLRDHHPDEALAA